MNEINIDKAYQNALDYLYSFIDYSLTRMDRNMADKFDLSRVAKLLELLGNPHQQYRVIHVAGTKGKGSASAMMASVLQKAGYRVYKKSGSIVQSASRRNQRKRTCRQPGHLSQRG